ncbi:MAG: arginine deiminase [bacterium]|nr:MAG: arginine deiminase [bacterium]
MNINVQSEIGELECVIIHTPGKEVEDMTPQSAERALYSDILNLSVVSREYSQFVGVLKKAAKVLEVRELLTEVVSNDTAKNQLLDRICLNEQVECIKDFLMDLHPREVAKYLIEGIPLEKDTLTKFVSSEKYSLQPLHNFFFSRDAAFVFNCRVVIARMASRVREREALIMETIFSYHPLFKGVEISNPLNQTDGNFIEGGDVLVGAKNILLIGIGKRTNTRGIDFVIDSLKNYLDKFYVLVQELPPSPESFIHLDMVFTILDHNYCMIYSPVILNPSKFKTIKMCVENGKVISISEEENLLRILNNLGFEYKPIFCGGDKDSWIQEREQWHSGTNFFALSPGRVIGYGQNVYTIEALQKNGFEIIDALDIIDEKTDLNSYQRCVVTIDGSELSRGGGGCRCMTLPVFRKPSSTS